MQKQCVTTNKARLDLADRIETLVHPSLARKLRLTTTSLRAAANSLIALLDVSDYADLIEQGLDLGLDVETLSDAVLHAQEWEDEDQDDPDAFRYSQIKLGVLSGDEAQYWLDTAISGEGPPAREKVRSIVKNGIRRPVVVDLNADFCVQGRHRLAAGIESGQPVPVVYLS